jgi:hypothetical protein
MGKKEKKIKNHEKKTKNKPIAHQDHQTPWSPPHMTLTFSTQNRLHLPLIKRA